MADAGSRLGAQRYDTPEILAYLQRLYAPEDEALRYALERIQAEGLPAIQIGPTEGKILYLLLRLAGARKVVEIGTLAGYSAIWIARALPPEGHLWTCERDPKHAAVARDVLQHAGLADRVTVVEGPASETLPNLEPQAPFDAVFVDADKGGYQRYGEWATQTLRPGGLLIGDNTYLFGRLVGGERPGARPVQPEEQASMRGFHELLAACYEAVCLPTPDGLAVGMLRAPRA